MAAAAVARTWVFRSWPLTRSELVWPLVIAAWTQLDAWIPDRAQLGHVVGPRPLLALLYLATSLSLAWRRRAPLMVLAFITVAEMAYYLAYGAPQGLGTVLPTLVAWYAVGRHLPLHSAIPGAALVLLGLVAHEVTDPIFQFTGLELVLWIVITGAWPLGYAFQRRAHEVSELAQGRDDAARLAVNEERARIARELHDVVGHGISVSVLQLVAALGLLDSSDLDAARTRVLNAERSSRDALAEMRRLLGLLDAEADVDLGPRPGLAQLECLVGETRSAGATVDVSLEGEPVQLSAGLDLAAFRILQEALTNVLKHASPRSAQVRVAYCDDSVRLEVRDHGIRTPPNAGGRGIAGMRERVRLYQGELEAGWCDDGGYAVRARLPLEPQ